MNACRTYKKRWALHGICAMWLLSLLVIPTGKAAAQQTGPSHGLRDNDAWYFRVTPYFFLSNIAGARTLGQPEDSSKVGEYITPVGASNLGKDFAGTVAFGKGRWGLSAYVESASAGNDRDFTTSTSPRDTLSGSNNFVWKEASVRVNHRVGPYQSPYVQVYAGVRWMNWTEDLYDVEGQSLGTWDEKFVDPMIGASTAIGLGAKFTATASVDLAGFAGSDLSWSISGGLDYHVYGPFSLTGMYLYKQVSYDNEEPAGPAFFEFKDGVSQGWYLGGSISIPGYDQ